MKKELIVLSLLFLFINLSFVNSAVAAINPGHSSEQIYIKYSGGHITLQHILDSSPSAVVSSYDTLPTTTPYHLASQVLITTSNGYKMTLQEAVDNNIFITGTTKSYNISIPAGGENASSINISISSGNITLYNAITQNKISSLCVPDYGKSCSMSGNASCIAISTGTTKCGGTCSGSYKPKGTACGSDDWHACNETGSCLGWKGIGCTTCPFGITGFACCPSGSSSCSTGWSCGTCKNLGIYQGYPNYSTNTWAYASPICGVGKLSQGISLTNEWKMKP